MIFKEKDPIEGQIHELALERPLPYRERQRLEEELAQRRAGLKGEEDAACHINFHICARAPTGRSEVKIIEVLNKYSKDGWKKDKAANASGKARYTQDNKTKKWTRINKAAV